MQHARVACAKMQLHVASDAAADPLRAVRPVGLQQPLAMHTQYGHHCPVSTEIIKHQGTCAGSRDSSDSGGFKFQLGMAESIGCIA